MPSSRTIYAGQGRGGGKGVGADEAFWTCGLGTREVRAGGSRWQQVAGGGRRGQ